jgi:glycosyltransferase involved in cell wall biosynthesis
MNILIINHYAGSLRHGMEYRHFYLAREWVKLGHKVTIVAASFSHLRTVNPDIKQNNGNEVIEGIQYIWLKTPIYRGNGVKRVLNLLTFAILLYTHAPEFIHNYHPDLVIASSPHPFIIYGANKIASFSKAKLFYEVRDLWPLTLIELGRMSRFHPFIMLMQWAENYAYRISDRIISLLPKAERYMTQHGMADNNFLYIPNGINTSEWHNEHLLSNMPHHTEVIMGLKQKGNFIVGYAGAHGLANELNSLIEAASILRAESVALVLVGNGPEKERLQQNVVQMNLSNVIFLPSVQKSNIPNLLAMMDALYIGLKDEALFRFGISPNKLMDYMMAAKPIIQAIRAGNDMVAESRCGITVAPENARAVADAIVMLMQKSPDARQSLGLKGREYVMAHHDYKILASRFLDAF